MNKDIKYLIEKTYKFNPIEYNNDDNDLIDIDTVKDIIYDSLPKFVGSEDLTNILNKFNWKENYSISNKVLRKDGLTDILYSDSYISNPIQIFLDYIQKYMKTEWVQYMDPNEWMSEEYCMIHTSDNKSLIITEHIGGDDMIYGNSIIIENIELSLNEYGLALLRYNKTPEKPNHFLSVYAPKELYIFLNEFIKLYTDNHINENLYDFDITDYDNDKNDIIDSQTITKLSKYMPKYNFEGADAILQMLNSLTWYETDGHEYDYFTYNTKKQFIVYQPIIKSTSTKFELGIPHSHNWILDMILYFDILKDVCWEKLNNKSERVLNNMPHTKIWIQHRDGPDAAYSPTCDIGIMFAEHLGKNKEGRTCFITQSHPNYKWEDSLLISFQGHRWDNINYCNRLIYAPVELTDMLSSFIRYITGNEVEINESVIGFNPANYSDESEDDIIDSIEIDNITYKNVFPGSIALIDILRKYDWVKMTTEFQTQDAYLGIISRSGDFDDLYNKIEECLMEMYHKYGDYDEYCTILFDDRFLNRPKQIVIQEHTGYGQYGENCIISGYKNDNINIRFQPLANHLFGKHIRCDIRLMRLLKEFVKNYE